MSKLFMYGSDFQELEQLMMLVPNFSPRRSGVIVVQKIRNEPKHVNSRKRGKFITEYCNSESNDQLLNQGLTGHMNYEEIINKCFKANDYYSLNKRLRELARSYGGNFFLNPIHESRFKTVCRIQGEPIESRETTYLASLFLLTADDKLWCAAKEHVYLDSFDFEKMHLNGINTDGYALYQMAKTLQRGQEYIKLNEISDKHLIGNRAFKVIIHSVMITKYGAAVLQMKI